MKKCIHFLQPLSDGSYNEMSKEEKTAFHLELDNFPECKKEFEKMELTIQHAKQISNPQPDKEYWNTFYDRLEPKLNIAGKNSIIKWPTLFQIAAMIMAGIFIGYLLFSPGVVSVNEQEINPDIKQTALYEQTSDVLEESKILLLGIVNMGDMNSTENIDFSFQKDISQNLLKQTADLKQQLRKDKNNRVVHLLNEIDIILMQIANIEESFDLPAIRMIQDGADKQSLLFKINMERLLLDAKNEHNKHKDISTKKEI